MLELLTAAAAHGGEEHAEAAAFGVSALTPGFFVALSMLVVFAIMLVYNFTFGIWMVSGVGSPWLLVREPMVGATLLGLLFLWQGWETPTFLTRSLELTGQMLFPLMLITLGVSVARLSPGALARPVVLSLLKAAVCIAAAWTMGRAFDLDPVPFAILVLQLSTPVAVTAFLIAQKYGADAEAVAGLVVVSTLVSIGLLPVLLGLLL